MADDYTQKAIFVYISWFSGSMETNIWNNGGNTLLFDILIKLVDHFISVIIKKNVFHKQINTF